MSYENYKKKITKLLITFRKNDISFHTDTKLDTGRNMTGEYFRVVIYF